MIDLIKSLIVGLVKGITEWLPISSTGHMIILNRFLKMGVTPEFFSMYEVVIQFGAVLAVVVLFFRELFCPILPKIPTEERKNGLRLWVKILISCLPAAVIGLLLGDKIDGLFFNPQTVSAALIVYGAAFIIIERNRRSDRGRALSTLSYSDAVCIGAFQALALIPGTSRSGATILGAILIGLSRNAAAEYTFLLAVPVMAGAGLLKIWQFGFSFQSAELEILLVGFAAAFFLSLVAIRFLIGFVKKHRFTGFGYYRIVLGAAALVLLFTHVI